MGIHSLQLAGEIAAASILGLVVLSAAVDLIRTGLSGPAPVFVASVDIPKAESQAAAEGWLHRSLVAFDIAFNVIVLRGQQDETISTHAWRAQQEGKLWGKLICKWLDGFQPNHGIRAASGDLERALARASVLKKALGLDS